MAYTIRKDDRIIDDIFEALDYYDAVSFELGERFEKEFKEAINKAEANPHYYFNLDDKCRRIKLESFPYMIVYVINENKKEVVVAGLFHCRRDPAMIAKRLGK